MIDINNPNLFGKVIADALAAPETSTTLTSANRLRWANAVGRAAAEIEENPFLDYDRENHRLLILSPSNNIYSANGVCQCKAYENGFPCWHRAAARIVRIYFEAVEAAGSAALAAPVGFDLSNAPYLKPDSGRTPVKVGNYRV